MEIRIHFKKPFNKDPLSMVHYLAVILLFVKLL